ncbi:MAG: hypothetical protein GXP29_00030 [Planctomycetes bacterium]|nr:hypothetical protein [Planctomycetota bacterium]
MPGSIDSSIDPTCSCTIVVLDVVDEIEIDWLDVDWLTDDCCDADWDTDAWSDNLVW